jgi:hypothetical protein
MAQELTWIPFDPKLMLPPSHFGFIQQAAQVTGASISSSTSGRRGTVSIHM